MLGIPPGGDLILTQEFNLQGLITEGVLPVSRADGLIKARVRRLKLEAPTKGQGAILIDTPPWEDAPSAYAFAKTWLGSSNLITQRFEVVQATISLHFEAPPGKRPKALHIDLKRNTTNINGFRRSDRELVERYPRHWQIIP
jgi:hypothetical protein